MNGSTTQPTRIITHRRPDVDLIGPVSVNCPKCGADLGPQIRITLESAWSASKRPAPREAYLVCLSCRKAWTAALWLSIAVYAAEGQVA